MTTDSQLVTELRARVHGITLTAAAPAKPKKKPAPPPPRPVQRPASWDESSPGKGWGGKFDESKHVRDTDPGEEGQFDFKEKEKKGRGGKSKAQSQAEKAARDSASAVRKRASERKAAEARARRTKAREVGSTQADLSDVAAEIAALGGTNAAARESLLRKQALLQLELLDAQLGSAASFGQRIALREQHLAEARSNGSTAAVIEALEIDIDAFKAMRGEVESRPAKKAKAEPDSRGKKFEADRRRDEAEHKRNREREREAQRKKKGVKASGSRWDAAILGAALSDGSYPILTVEDWHKANTAAKRAPHNKKVAQHIEKRGKALGLT